MAFSSDDGSSSGGFGLSGLSSLSPPGGFTVSPPSAPGSSTSSNSRWGGGLETVSSPRPSLGRDDLYLYGYGKQFGEKLTYSAGVAYAAGILLGGAYGLGVGINKGGETARLRVNALLNGCSTHAPRLASEFGALSLFYCCFNNLLITARGDSEIHAPIAGGLAGCLYKSRGSWRVFSTYGIASSLGFSAIDQYMRRYL